MTGVSGMNGRGSVDGAGKKGYAWPAPLAGGVPGNSMKVYPVKGVFSGDSFSGRFSGILASSDTLCAEFTAQSYLASTSDITPQGYFLRCECSGGPRARRIGVR